ncbi:hypothetical protein [Xanthomonas campestris]|uniref:hypothetical protein n=1 Tax=Xanthomonas campestris TaxID=339 RepID=UPI001290216B|nr:hypothetical protein [Xanthomonas campestris]
MLKDIAARENSFIHVRAQPLKCADLSNYKIYVNGNIRRTPQRLTFLKTSASEVLAVVPGEYRVVVREAEVDKPNRAESNTVLILVEPRGAAHLLLGIEGGVLSLIREDA